MAKASDSGTTVKEVLQQTDYDLPEVESHVMVNKANCAVVTYTAIFGSEKAPEESKAPDGDSYPDQQSKTNPIKPADRNAVCMTSSMKLWQCPTRTSCPWASICPNAGNSSSMENLNKRRKGGTTMRDKYILTAESVTEGHPDKLCDTIADSVLDACLQNDPAARVACEVMATAGKIIVAREITAKELPDIPAIVCRTVREAGYGGSDYEVEAVTHDQSGDIAGAVFQTTQMGAGDQGIMYGYACNETVELLPMPVVLANRLTLLLTNTRRTGSVHGLGPDGKAQVSVEYQGGKPHRIAAVVVSGQHDADKDMDELIAFPGKSWY